MYFLGYTERTEVSNKNPLWNRW